MLTRNANIRLYLQLGFMTDLTKSSLVPYLVMTDLGAWIDTIRGIVMATTDKVR